MKEKEFNELLQQLEEGTFIGNEVEICTKHEGLLEQGFDLNNEKLLLLCNALNKNPHITNLELSDNDIEDSGAIILAELTNIKRLGLSGNHVGATGIGMLVKNTNLHRLGLGGIYIDWSIYSDAEITGMCDALIDNKTITSLNLTMNNIPEYIVARIIGGNKAIKYLELIGNNFSGEVLKYIGNNTTLEELNLCRNAIGNKGCEYIAKNHSLIQMNLGENNITDIGANFLSMHPTLKNLAMFDTQITITGARSFIGSNLEELIFEGKGISSQEYRDWKTEFESSHGARDMFLQAQEQLVNMDLTGDIEY